MSTSHTPHTTATGCADWLRAHLADGARSAADVRAAAAAAGYTWRTVQRAALALGVQSQRSGFGPGAGYVWTAAKLRAAGEGAGEPKRGEGMRDTTALPPGTPAPGTPAPGTPQPGAHAAAPAPPQASPVPQAQSGSAAAAAAEYAAARAMRADALVTWCGHSRAAAEAQAWLEYPLDADTVRRNAAAAAGDPQTH